MTGRANELEHRIGPRGRFELRQAGGDIRIRGGEGDQVRVRMLESDGDLAADFEVTTGDGLVRLQQRDGLGLGLLRGRRARDLEVELPHGATVSIETASGDVTASDLSGDKRFRSASGDIRLERHAGPISAESVSGDIEVTGQAPVDAIIKSVSGDIRVRVPSLRRIDLGTTSGDIAVDATLDGPGPFALRSISGDATIVGRTGLRVEAETITGELSSELPSKRESQPGRKVLVIGRPGPTLAFRSVSGDLRVVEPRDAGPVMDPVTATPTAAGTAVDEPLAPVVTNPTDADARRLAILRALEAGEISVTEAVERLGRLEEVLA